MSILETAMEMLKKHPLCNHCLGRQFAMLGRGIDNGNRGKARKLSLPLQASALHSEKNAEGFTRLKDLVINGFSTEAEETLRQMKKRIPKRQLRPCYLCEDKFQSLEMLMDKALKETAHYEYTTFLVGVELPFTVEEREDEFKAEFSAGYGDSIRNEFGRLLGKK